MDKFILNRVQENLRQKKMHLLFDIILASLTLISPCYSCFLAGMAVVGLARERLWPLYRMGRKVT